MQRRRLLSLFSPLPFLAVGLAATLGLAGCEGKQPFQSFDLTDAKYARGFELPDFDGQTRRLQDFRGKLVVVFFGFTQCPDVCPTAMTDLVEVKRQLGADGDKLQAVFVTVDPERDTPEVLKAYIANFDPSFVGLRGTPEQLAQVVQEFKVYYKKVEGKTPGAYTMDHSAASFIYDTQGRLRLYLRPGAGPQVLLGDLQLLLKER
ncbi:MAG: SCO family protein [Ramlibacter sp.]|uniref:SCO family protein n=1 Tax=Ramlibacter sp. TaxID=1917967 RepID=UPI002637B1DC|nr:SCO family protein [Ramlibacter sp.]MDH4377416.1 SCO family protein [Ramlibacter sp.]